MIVTISPVVDPRFHREIKRIVRLGFWGVDRDDVVVDVRGREEYAFSGSAHAPLRQVLLRLPYTLEPPPRGHYPLLHTDRRLLDGPVTRITCWREELLQLAAHEASHVRQYDHPKPGKRGRMLPRQSERTAETWAARIFARQQPKINQATLRPPVILPVEEEMPGPDLIDYLTAKQAEMQLNDTRFCRYLGLPDLSTWMRYKTRSRPPPLRLLQLAARHWPEDRDALWSAALASQVRGGTLEAVSA